MAEQARLISQVADDYLPREDRYPQFSQAAAILDFRNVLAAWVTVREEDPDMKLEASVARLQKMAEGLMTHPGYWGSFREPAALMGWIFHEGVCVYCRNDLVTPEHMSAGHGSTDHLIPHTVCSKRLPGLPDPDKDWLNLVPCCCRCNGLKGYHDPRSADLAASVQVRPDDD